MYNNQADSPPKSISAGAVVGIGVAALIIIILVFGILWWKGYFGKKNSLATGNHKETTFVVITVKLFAEIHELFNFENILFLVYQIFNLFFTSINRAK